MIPWLLIPVKSLAAGKGRLAGALQPASRRRLNEFFLRRMLRIAADFPGCDRTAVISGCGDVLRIAASYGATPIRQRQADGLNAAAAQGVAALRRVGAENVLVIACDEPLVRAVDLREIVRDGPRRSGIVICPDKHGAGTNALYLPSHAALRFQFGQDSFFEHLREAARHGLAAEIHVNERIALDIDTPADFDRWLRSRRRAPLMGKGRLSGDDAVCKLLEERAGIKRPRSPLGAINAAKSPPGKTRSSYPAENANPPSQAVYCAFTAI